MSSSQSIRVMVADDEEGVRDMLGVLFSTEPDLEMTGAAADAEEAIDMATRLGPDVALLDVRMPGGGGVRAAREIVRRCPDTKVIALSASEDLASVLELLQAGARSFVSKSDPVEELLWAIRRAVEEDAAAPDASPLPVVSAIAEHLDHRRPAHRRRLQRERIERILGERGYTMVYQPIVDLETSEVVGIEALARFLAFPHRAPDAWIAEADAVGLLAEVELALARAALDDLDRIPPNAYLAVNVSPETAASDALRELIDEAWADRIVLEMTEHLPVEDYDATRVALKRLREQGVRIAVDDAGAGFASLRHVVRLSPDFIKLDVTLTKQIDIDPVRQALAVSLSSFAEQVGAVVIAEGVESVTDLDALRQAGVRYAQGFLLGEPRPLPATNPVPDPSQGFVRAS
jgi:EAL domain-containing protein (putative c-di-GMP-specific phosphodiesterase class I)/DNA-binding NarL/FixJ family response regulator